MSVQNKMVPQKCALPTTSEDVKMKQDVSNNNKEHNEKVITYNTNEVQLHTTKDVLLDHLCAKVQELLPDVDASQVSLDLIHRHAESYIFRLLQDPKLLCDEVQLINKETQDVIEDQHPKERVNDSRQLADGVSEAECSVHSMQQMETVSQDKLHIGEDLFHKVADIETELCAQVTGMLLEMDKESLNKLLHDDNVLETAVSRAKTKYLAKHHPSVLPGRDDIGEELYDAVHNIYPEYAAKITGMLLELDMATLQQLLDSPSQLEVKARMAYDTVKHGFS